MFQRRAVINLITNLLSLLVSIAAGIVLVPFLINHIGLESYGLIPLANNFTQYLAPLSSAINSAVGRHLAWAFEKQQTELADEIVSTAFKANLVLALVSFGLLMLLVIFLDRIVVLPSESVITARYFFAATFFSFFLGLVSSAFGGVLWSRNRLDFLNVSGILRQLLYFLLTILLVSFIQPNLISVGNSVILSSLVSTAILIGAAKHVASTLHYYGNFNWSIFKELLSMSTWISINLVGSVLFLRIDLFVLNRFAGPEAAGKYAALLQWSIVLRMFAAAISNVFGPPMAFLFAKHNLQELRLYTHRAVRFVGLAIAFPVGLVCGLASPLLFLWLGSDFQTFSNLLIILTLPICVNAAVYPLFELQTATNRVRLPALITCFMGIANFILVMLVAFYANSKMYGVAIVGVTMLTLKNAIFTPVYSAVILKEPLLSFIKDMTLIVLTTLFVAVIGQVWQHFLNISSWEELALSCLIIGTIYFIFLWFLMPKQDKRFLLDLISSWRQGVEFHE